MTTTYDLSDDRLEKMIAAAPQIDRDGKGLMCDAGLLAAMASEIQSLRSAQTGGCRQTANSELLGGRSSGTEVEVVAWRGGKEDGSSKYTEIKRVSEIWADQGMTIIPLVRQSALIAVIAAKDAEIERLDGECQQLMLDISREQERAEAAEARANAAEALVREFASRLEDEGPILASDIDLLRRAKALNGAKP